MQKNRLSIYLSIFITWICFNSSSFANILVQERFPLASETPGGYYTGDLNGGPTATAGVIGFNGAWNKNDGTQIKLYGASKNLQFPENYVQAGFSSTGGSVGTNKDANNADIRTFFRALDPNAFAQIIGNKLYFRMLISIDSNAINRLGNTGDGLSTYYGTGFIYSSQQPSKYTQLTGAPRLMWFGFSKDNNGKCVAAFYARGASDSSATRYIIVPEVVAGDTYICCAEIELDAGTDGKEVIKAGIFNTKENNNSFPYTTLTSTSATVEHELFTLNAETPIALNYMIVGGCYGANGYALFDEIVIADDILDAIVPGEDYPLFSGKPEITNNGINTFTITETLTEGYGSVYVTINDQERILIAENATKGQSFSYTYVADTFNKFVDIKFSCENDLFTNDRYSTEIRLYTGSISITSSGDINTNTSDTGSFVISRNNSAESTEYDQTVEILIRDGTTAVKNFDYELSTTVTIPAGEASVTVPVRAIYNPLNRGSQKTLSVEIANSKCLIDAASSTASMNITYNDNSQSIVYVAPDGSNENQGTEEAPFATIAHAIDTLSFSSTQSGIIYVKPGTYTLNDRTTVEGVETSTNSYNVIQHNISIIGTTGNPNDVIIQKGNNQYRIFYINNADAYIANITIQNGNIKHNGGNVYIDTNGGTIYNCIINNGDTKSVYNGTGGNIYALGGKVIRCLITNGKNGSGHGANGGAIEAKNTIIDNCLFYGNINNKSDAAVISLSNSVIMNSTVVNNKTPENAYIVSVNATSYMINTIIADNCDNYDKLTHTNITGTHNNVYNCASDQEIIGGNNMIHLQNGAAFVNPLENDYRITLISSCYSTGLSVNEASTLTGKGFIDIDFFGNSRGLDSDIGYHELHVNGPTTAFEAIGQTSFLIPYTIDFRCVSAGLSGDVTYTFDFGDGTIVQTTDTTISHTYTTANKYNITVTASDNMGASASDTKSNYIKAAPDVIYVDQNCTTPLFPYSTLETAVNSLIDAIDEAESGSTIIMAIGEYVSTDTIVINKDITIKGITNSPKDSTLRANNVRILYLNNSNALIHGITISGGQTYLNSDSANVHITSNGGTISNCVFSSISANGEHYEYVPIKIEGGLITHSTITNCNMNYRSREGLSAPVVIRNQGRLENCLLVDNKRLNAAEYDTLTHISIGIAMNSGYAINNTIVKNQNLVNLSKSIATAGAAVVLGGTFKNNVIAGNTLEVVGDTTYKSNVYFSTDADVANCATDDEAPINGTSFIGTTTSLFQNYELGFYLPAYNSPLINNGIDGLTSALLDKNGNPRINDGHIDIGAFESAPSSTIIIIL